MIYDSFSPEELARRLHCESLLVLERVTSTQDLLRQMADEGAPCNTVVLADEQVRGRGRQNRAWLAERGRSVLFSYLLRPPSRPAGSVTSLRVGLAVLETLGDLGIDAMLKWPNDVLVRGRKVAGILCEGRWRGDRLLWLVAGIGINVHGPVPQAVADKAIALDEVTGNVSRIDVLERLLPRLGDMPEDNHLSAEELEAVRRHDWLVDREISGPVSGRACGVAQDGALCIATANGTVTVVGGEVVLA